MAKCSVVRIYLNSGGYTSQGHYCRDLDCFMRAKDRAAALEVLRRDNPGIEFYRS